MAIKVKEVVENVRSYTRDNDGDVNATEEFKKLSKEKLATLKEVLGNEEATSTDLINSLDELVYAILDYRYNIVDYGHYTDDDDDNGRSHLRVSK
jgi:hypothetical protein